MTTPRGHLSYGYVIYDHKLPTLQRKAYRLELDGTVERKADYPEMRSAEPEELRTVMELLQESMNKNPYVEKPKGHRNHS